MAEHRFFDRARETAPREKLQAAQLGRLRQLLSELLPTNRFYAARLNDAGLQAPGDVRTLDDVSALPFTTKAELLADQAEHPPFGTNLTFPLERYVRIHQTSGTSGGRPLRVLDTPESWRWWLDCWRFVLAGAGLTPADRVFCAFSFGPFVGFWTAYESIPLAGALAIPGGGQDSLQRLRTIWELEATVLVSTPTYALRLAEVARQHGIDTVRGPIRRTIHAGEPGASIPSTRRRIDEAWGAECHDHSGLSEVGATGFTCRERSGVHLIESEYLFEVIDPRTAQTVGPGQRGELVVTNFGRVGMPVIRYRTGDLVELDDSACGCGRTWSRMDGGILGRADDMVVIRGVNVFPSSIEDVVREFDSVSEFRLELIEERQMQQLRLTIEPAPNVPADDARRLAQTIGDEIQRRLYLKIACDTAPVGALPRFELKARRFVRHADAGSGA